MRIICFGDSLTFGHGLSFDEKWHVIVEKKTGIQMINRGVSGNTTTEMLARFNRQVLLMQPEEVIIMGGYNDVFFENTYEKVKDNLKTMIYKAQKKGIIVIVAVPPPIKLPIRFFENEPKLKFNSDLIDEYLDWLRKYLEEEKLPCIDFGYEIDWINDDLYLDGIHPNAKGSNLMAEALIKFLSRDKLLNL
ncbi:GDSL-type esterase/lipase family protein [Eubacteriaceae bacterium ES3]|nr:GDSL-type esterase/lipase family protein [Eubacteriaceae bacterium ES3]